MNTFASPAGGRKVWIGKVALVARRATVTLAPTTATDGFELVNSTTEPRVGAAVVRVTVPTDDVPPTTLAGFKVKLWIGTGFTVKDDLTLLPDEFTWAVIVAVVAVDTDEVKMTKLALL